MNRHSDEYGDRLRDERKDDQLCVNDLLSQRRALVADLRSCGSDRLTRATIEAQIKMLDGEIAEAHARREPLTADTITDEMIRELRDGQGHRRFRAYGQTWSIWQLCMDAMARPDYQRGDARTRIWERTRALELCADLFNAAQAGLAEDWLINARRSK